MNTNMTEFGWFSKVRILGLWAKVTPLALEAFKVNHDWQ